MGEIGNLKNRNRAIEYLLKEIDEKIYETQMNILNLQNNFHKQRVLHSYEDKILHKDILNDLCYVGNEVFEKGFIEENENQIKNLKSKLEDLE